MATATGDGEEAAAAPSDGEEAATAVGKEETRLALLSAAASSRRSTREPSRRNTHAGWRGSGWVDRAGPTSTLSTKRDTREFSGF